MNIYEEHIKDVKDRNNILRKVFTIPESSEDDDIFSIKYGFQIDDIISYWNMYKCKCGRSMMKVNNGLLCPICHTKVKKRKNNIVETIANNIMNLTDYERIIFMDIMDIDLYEDVFLLTGQKFDHAIIVNNDNIEYNNDEYLNSFLLSIIDKSKLDKIQDVERTLYNIRFIKGDYEFIKNTDDENNESLKDFSQDSEVPDQIAQLLGVPDWALNDSNFKNFVKNLFIIDNKEHTKLNENNESLKDSNSNSFQKPDKLTIRYCKDIGIFNCMPNGFDIYDYDIEVDGEPLKLTHPTFGAKFLMDLEIILISPDPYDYHIIPALYVKTDGIRKKANLSDEEFIKIIEEEHSHAEGNGPSEKYINLFK